MCRLVDRLAVRSALSVLSIVVEVFHVVFGKLGIQTGSGGLFLRGCGMPDMWLLGFCLFWPVGWQVDVGLIGVARVPRRNGGGERRFGSGQVLERIVQLSCCLSWWVRGRLPICA